MTDCNHERTTSGPATGYTGSVAREPYTESNPAAAGGITFTQTCARCGAERRVNQNQSHVEYSPWSADRATRDQWARRDAARERARKIEAGRKTMRENQVEIGALERNGVVNVFVRGKRRIVAMDEIRAAAEQHDNGDGLVPYYMALREAIERKFKE